MYVHKHNSFSLMIAQLKSDTGTMNTRSHTDKRKCVSLVRTSHENDFSRHMLVPSFSFVIMINNAKDCQSIVENHKSEKIKIKIKYKFINLQATGSYCFPTGQLPMDD